MILRRSRKLCLPRAKRVGKLCLHINTKNPKVVTVVLKKGGKILASLNEKNEYGSQALLPLIAELLAHRECDFSDLEEITVEEGPGSFTGLKVGASVAQAFGFVLNIPVNGQLNKPVPLRYT